MGHYASEMMSEEEAREQTTRFDRIREAGEKFDALKDIPVSRFTFGELDFLLYLNKTRFKSDVGSDHLEHLREIVARVTAEAPA